MKVGYGARGARQPQGRAGRRHPAARMVRVDAADLTTCAITREGEGGPRCSRRAVTTMSAYQPAYEADGVRWPELDLSFGVCTEHLETFTGSYLKGEVGLGMVQMGNTEPLGG